MFFVCAWKLNAFTALSIKTLSSDFWSNFIQVKCSMFSFFAWKPPLFWHNFMLKFEGITSICNVFLF